MQIFIAQLVATVKKCQQPKCLSTNEKVKRMWYTQKTMLDHEKE